MVAVSLIVRDPHWFKSLQELDGEATYRESSFYAHASVEPSQLLVTENALADMRFHDNPAVTEDPFIRFYAGAPLLSSDGFALGTLCVFDPVPRSLRPEQAEAMWALSRQVGRLLEMRLLMRDIARHESERDWYEARLAEYYLGLEQVNSELSELIRTDPLTGLPNRRVLAASLAELLERADGGQAPPAVALVEINHFKQVNDLHGHSQRDLVFMWLGSVLRAQFSGRGMAARYGGEEFVILMPGTALHEARLQCEYLRESITLLPIGLPISISVGLAVHRCGDTPAQTLQRANAALYQAKHQGRDRVIVAD